MEFVIQDWHWLAFGMLLVMAEVFIPSFTIFWFGLGAVIVAAILWWVPDFAVSWQLVVWALSSSLFAALWFRFLKPLMVDRTKAGIAREAISGESGQVIKVPQPGGRGVVRFTTPLLGDDEWDFICDSDAENHNRVTM